MIANFCNLKKLMYTVNKTLLHKETFYWFREI